MRYEWFNYLFDLQTNHYLTMLLPEVDVVDVKQNLTVDNNHTHSRC